MRDDNGHLCVWCDNGECVLNHIGTRGATPNFCMPEITGCIDFHDCGGKPELAVEVSDV
jgi:hypothetical protein